MNKQEVFDKVSKHLLTQNMRSIDSRGACKYRAINGLKCAVGCLIPDEVYDPSMEGFRINHWKYDAHLQIKTAPLEWMLESDMSRLLNRLQDIHDSEDDPSLWEEKLRKLASDFGLVFNNE